jgi:nucleotide-binding universal stress UspA family protein
MVPMRLAVDVPLPGDADLALRLLEAIEQRAARAEVAVDARIERGRTVRHALRELMRHEHFERMVIAAGPDGGGEGFGPEDIAWLMRNIDGELIALRPGAASQTRLREDTLSPRLPPPPRQPSEPPASARTPV